MTPQEAISLEIDGTPVLFELSRDGGLGSYMLLADGTVIDRPARASLSHYGRTDLTHLFRQAVREGKMLGAQGLSDATAVRISGVRGYLHLPEGLHAGVSRIMLHRVAGGDWACSACQQVDCEHVEIFLRKLEMQGG